MIQVCSEKRERSLNQITKSACAIDDGEFNFHAFCLIVSVIKFSNPISSEHLTPAWQLSNKFAWLPLFNNERSAEHLRVKVNAATGQ